MDYNKFRIWVGRILGLIFLLFVKNKFNFYALLVMVIGISVRIWASGYIHKSQEVTMAGPYKLLRHPLYLGNFLTGLGFTILVTTWQLTIFYILIFFIVYSKKMQLEEKYLLGKFGEQYKFYQETTPLFIPSLSKFNKKDNTKFCWQCVILNKEHLNLLGSAIIIIFFLAVSKL